MNSSPRQKSRLTGNIVWNYFSGIASIVGLLLLYPFAIAISGAEAYGLWVLAFGAIQLFTLSDFGLGTGIVRLLAVIKDPLERRRFVTLATTIFLSLGVLLLAIFSVAFPAYLNTVSINAQVAKLLPLLVPLTGFTLFVSIAGRAYNAVLWAEDRPDIERKSSLAGLILRAAGYAVSFWAGWGAVGVILSEAISLMIPAVVCAIAVFRRYSWPVFHRGSFSIHGLPLLKMSGVLFIGSFALLAGSQFPLYVVGTTLGLTAATAFGGLMRLYQSCRLLLSWIANPFIHPIMTSTKEGLLALYKRCAGLVWSLGLLLAIPVFILSKDIIDIWLGRSSEFAQGALAMLGIGILADAVIQPASQLVNLRRNPWLISLANMGVLLLSIPLILWASSSGDITLTTLATVVVPFVACPLYLIWAWQTVGLRWTKELTVNAALLIAALALLVLVLLLFRAIPIPILGLALAGLSELAVAAVGYLFIRRRMGAQLATG
ncbi:O-antigen/teichoic acid export membrane protein [Psychromicrobium silvestre]|uniref:O-antigen/teichoic acid export membrane protein n=1 Tax=Psychromicrobium silvestre TaxID=1645614 RepID=A0A7Y9LS57_9MICC|nr:lipopolysaccharide biosynthesis protein [Psychromicrobium silvestre]NYE94600.1 O-antigen/teichoic acid export membrane protein [Psychromicrobium silvestre]